MSKQAFLTIKEDKYIIDAFKGMEGWRYLPKVTKLILPFIFGNSAEDESKEKSVEDIQEAFGELESKQKNIDEEKVIPMLMDLLSGDNAEEIINLVPDLLSRVTKNGVKIDFDEEFSQNYLTMFKLVFEVLKLNYLSSFQKLDTK